MKTGTARYAKHYEIAAYGESAVRWGYNHWWSKTFLLGFSANDLSPIVGPVPLREIDHIRPPPWQTQPEAGN